MALVSDDRDAGRWPTPSTRPRASPTSEYEKPYDPWEDAEEDSGSDAEAEQAVEFLDIAALRNRTSKGSLPGS